MQQLKSKIREIKDFPKAGIDFKDITPLLSDPTITKVAIDELIKPYKGHNISAVVGMEARGFIFGSLVAWELGVGFVPLRKAGKLPSEVESVSYSLEYGHEKLEIHKDALNDNDKVLLVDDVLATGGTARASCELIEKLGAKIIGCSFLIELGHIHGRKLLDKYTVHSVIQYF